MIDQFESGDISQAQFCTRHRLNMGTFRAWLYRLRGESVTTHGKPPKFIEVAAVNSEAAISVAKCLLRVGEVQIEFQSPPSAVYLSELLTGLRSLVQ